jgi:hypothetical protein
VPGLIADPKLNDISLRAPNKPGAYRLFAYVFDGKGHAAHVNIPFYVDESAKSPPVVAAPDSLQTYK